LTSCSKGENSIVNAQENQNQKPPIEVTPIDPIKPQPINELLLHFGAESSPKWTQDDYVDGSCLDKDSNVYFIVNTKSESRGGLTDMDVILFKYDSVGQEVYRKRFTTPVSTADEVGTKLICSDKTIYLVGHTKSAINGASAGDFDPLVIAFDKSSGDTQWASHINLPALTKAEECKSLVEMSDRLYLFCHSNSYSTDRDVVIFALNKTSGSYEDSHRFSEIGGINLIGNEFLYDAIEYKGKLYFVGITSTKELGVSGTGDGFIGRYDPVTGKATIKIMTDFDNVYSKSSDGMLDISAVGDNIFVSGYINQKNYKCFVLKLTDMELKEKYLFDTSVQSYPCKSSFSSLGGVVTANISGKVGDVYSGGQDILVIKLTTDLAETSITQLSAKTHDSFNDFSLNENLYGVRYFSNGFLGVYGSTNSSIIEKTNATNKTDAFFLMMKFD